MMTIPRLYYPHPLSLQSTYMIEGNQAHYLLQVLRLKEGDNILLFNADNGEMRAMIISLSKKSLQVYIKEQTRQPYHCPDIWLLFAPVKAGRIDFLVEKATELGVSRLLPVKTDRTIVSRVNQERLLANAIEAAEQTERCDIPVIEPYQPLEKLLAGWDMSRPLIYGDERGNGQSALTVFKKVMPPLALLIGPEGGFSEKEYHVLQSLEFMYPVSLGKRILRADTAALSALTLLQACCGDWYQ